MTKDCLVAISLLFHVPAVVYTSPDPRPGGMGGDHVWVDRTVSSQETYREIRPGSENAGQKSQEGERTNRARITAAVAAAVCLASGAAAHHYTSKATDSYDRYLQAGNPRDMNRYFNETESFDAMAGYSLALFEISFFVSLVSFIRSLEE